MPQLNVPPPRPEESWRSRGKPTVSMSPPAWAVPRLAGLVVTASCCVPLAAWADDLTVVPTATAYYKDPNATTEFSAEDPVPNNQTIYVKVTFSEPVKERHMNGYYDPELPIEDNDLDLIQLILEDGSRYQYARHPLPLVGYRLQRGSEVIIEEIFGVDGSLTDGKCASTNQKDYICQYTMSSEEKQQIQDGDQFLVVVHPETRTVRPSADEEPKLLGGGTFVPFSNPPQAGEGYSYEGYFHKRSLTITTDNSEKPEAKISVDNPRLAADDTAEVTIKFSHPTTNRDFPVTGFVLDDIELYLDGEKASAEDREDYLSEFEGEDGDSTYTAKLTPPSDKEGKIMLNVPADVAWDENNANNGNKEAPQLTVDYDTQAPTVEEIKIFDEEDNELTGFTEGKTAIVRVTFSEGVTLKRVTDLENPGHLKVSEGTGDIFKTLLSLNGSETIYAAQFTPTDTTSTIMLTIPSGVAEDDFGNENSEYGPSDPGSQTNPGNPLDPSNPTDPDPPTDPITDPAAQSPTATITVADGGALLSPGETITKPATVTVTFSQTVTGFDFDAGDLKVSAGTLSEFEGKGGDSVYTATLTPPPNAEGEITLDVAANVAQSGSAGNKEASQFTVNYDTERPTTTITLSHKDLSLGETTKVTVTFSQAVTGFSFDAGDLKASAGTLSEFKSEDGSKIYTATLTPPPNAKGTITLSIAAGVAEDGAGNGNTAATEKTLSYNTINIATASQEALEEVNIIVLPDVLHHTMSHHMKVLTSRVDTMGPRGRVDSPISMEPEEMANGIATAVFDYGDELASGTFNWQQALAGRSFSFPMDEAGQWPLLRSHLLGQH